MGISMSYVRVAIGLIVIVNLLFMSSCSFTREVKTGGQAFDRKQYDIAVTLLPAEFEESLGPLKATKAFQLGQSHYYLKETKEAARWYAKAAELDYGPVAYLELGRMLKRLQRFDEAEKAFLAAQSYNNSDPIVNRELASVRVARQWADKPDPTIRIEDPGFNSIYADYAPTFIDDNYLVFTSDRDEATGNLIYDWTGNKYSDLFVVHKNGSKVSSFDAMLNSEHNDGSFCITKDGQGLYFTRCMSDTDTEDAHCALYYSAKDNELWSDPVLVDFFGPKVSFGQPALLENDSVLVFTARTEAYGYDLFYSVLEEEGWSLPERMPESINTQGDEYFPTAHEDTLYFSSDYLAGMGGLDIFKTYLRYDGSWSPPLNLQAPINSTEDDFHYVVDPTTPDRSGFITSNRAGDTDDDIYRWRYVPPAVTDTIDVDTETPDRLLYLAGVVYTPTYAEENNPNSQVTGRKPIAGATVEIGPGLTLTSDKDGRFISAITPNTDYQIKASKRGYLNNVYAFNTAEYQIPDGEEIYTINIEIPLDQIFAGVEIVLQDIYYDFDKWNIRPDAMPTLNKLAELLRNNPQIDIELASHTDCRGDDAYNQNLSQKRAQSAVRYIEQNGISGARMTPVGYGESRPADDCPCESCTEEQHQSNRRTTFTIVEK